MIPARRGKIYPRPRATSPRTVRVYLALVVRVRALACNTRLDAKFQLFLLLPLRYCSFYFRLFPPPSLSLSRSYGWRWFFSHVSTKILSLCVFLLSAHFPLPFSPCVKLDFTLGFRNPRHTRLQHVSFYLFFFFSFLFIEAVSQVIGTSFQAFYDVVSLYMYRARLMRPREFIIYFLYYINSIQSFPFVSLCLYFRNRKKSKMKFQI